MGDAAGAPAFTAATGSVTKTGESITTTDQLTGSQERLSDLIKITSDVVSGDSGGATYDDQGNVIGMTTAASQGSHDINGYAIPIVKVLKVSGDLRNKVSTSAYTYGYPGFLGIGLSQGNSTTITKVYAGSGAAAGLTAGETITAIDGSPVNTPTTLKEAVSGHQPGDTIKVGWVNSRDIPGSTTVTLKRGPIA